MSEDILERVKASLKRHDPINQGFYTSMPFEDVQIWKELITEVEANQIMLRQFQVHEDQTHAAMEKIVGNSDNFVELTRQMKAEVERLRSENEALNEKLIEAKAKEIYPFNMPHWDNLPEEDTVDKLCPTVTRRGKAYWRKEATRQLAEEMKEVDWE